MVTAEQKKAGLAILLAVSETVREAKRVPSGTVYAALIGRVTFEGYQALIRTLKGAGLIEEKANELIWVGPEVRA